LTSSTSEGGGRKRAQRQVNMKKILEGYFCTLTQKFQQPMLSSWVLHRTHIHRGKHAIQLGFAPILYIHIL
jgi:hypothetical protein